MSLMKMFSFIVSIEQCLCNFSISCGFFLPLYYIIDILFKLKYKCLCIAIFKHVGIIIKFFFNCCPRILIITEAL